MDEYTGALRRKGLVFLKGISVSPTPHVANRGFILPVSLAQHYLAAADSSAGYVPIQTRQTNHSDPTLLPNSWVIFSMWASFHFTQALPSTQTKDSPQLSFRQFYLTFYGLTGHLFSQLRSPASWSIVACLSVLTLLILLRLWAQDGNQGSGSNTESGDLVRPQFIPMWLMLSSMSSRSNFLHFSTVKPQRAGDLIFLLFHLTHEAPCDLRVQVHWLTTQADSFSCWWQQTFSWCALRRVCCSMFREVQA